MQNQELVSAFSTFELHSVRSSVTATEVSFSGLVLCVPGAAGLARGSDGTVCTVLGAWGHTLHGASARKVLGVLVSGLSVASLFHDSPSPVHPVEHTVGPRQCGLTQLLKVGHCPPP